MRFFYYEDDRFTVHHTRDEHPAADAFAMHVHTGCELYCFLAGNGYYTVEGNRYALTPDTILLIRSGEAHTLHIFPDCPYERIAVHFPPDLLAGEPPALTALFTGRPLGQHNSYPPDEGHTFLRACLLRLCAPESDGRSAAEMTARIRAYLLPVLYELSRRAPAAAQPADKPDDRLSPAAGTPLAAAAAVSSAIDYINNHLAEPMSPETLARRSFFSVSHFNKAFRAATGSSVWAYILVKRLLFARELIRAGQPAALSAARAGFTDYSSFYRQYRRRFGVCPTADKHQGR